MFMHEKRDLSRVMATERAAAAAYREAGKTPADVDVVELHDCFTIAEIVATEGLGFFGARHGRGGGGERMDEPRGQDSRQSLGRSQGQGASHRSDGGGPDRGDRHQLRGEADRARWKGRARA
jgi:hypothetical protein